MNFLLDTCVLSDFFKKDISTIAHFQEVSPGQLFVSTITVMEVEYGLKLHAEREIKIRPLWKSLCKQIQIVPFCSECAEAAASFRAALKSSGKLIGSFDILIAATAQAHNLILVTSNLKEFNRIPTIEIENWRM
jgi:tRNA(fMet)-specific endonuclease VapC